MGVTHAYGTPLTNQESASWPEWQKGRLLHAAGLFYLA